MKLGNMLKPRTTYISPSNCHIAISGARYAYQVAGSKSITLVYVDGSEETRRTGWK